MKQKRHDSILLSALLAVGCGSDVVTRPDVAPVQMTMLTRAQPVAIASSSDLDLLLAALMDASERVAPELDDVSTREGLRSSLAELIAAVGESRTADTKRALQTALSVISRAGDLDADLAAISLVLDQVEIMVENGAPIPTNRTQKKAEILP